MLRFGMKNSLRCLSEAPWVINTRIHKDHCGYQDLRRSPAATHYYVSLRNVSCFRCSTIDHPDRDHRRRSPLLHGHTSWRCFCFRLELRFNFRQLRQMRRTLRRQTDASCTQRWKWAFDSCSVTLMNALAAQLQNCLTFFTVLLQYK